MTQCDGSELLGLWDLLQSAKKTVHSLTSEDCGFWPVISLPSATTCSDQSPPYKDGLALFTCVAASALYIGRMHQDLQRLALVYSAPSSLMRSSMENGMYCMTSKN